MKSEVIIYKLKLLNNNWKLTDNKLHIKIEFKTFKDCFNFMNTIAIESEKNKSSSTMDK